MLRRWKCRGWRCPVAAPAQRGEGRRCCGRSGFLLFLPLLLSKSFSGSLCLRLSSFFPWIANELECTAKIWVTDVSTAAAQYFGLMIKNLRRGSDVILPLTVSWRQNPSERSATVSVKSFFLHGKPAPACHYGHVHLHKTLNQFIYVWKLTEVILRNAENPELEQKQGKVNILLILSLQILINSSVKRWPHSEYFAFQAAIGFISAYKRLHPWN